MSTTESSSPDTQATDRAWEEIRQLIDELARMAKAPISPSEFYTGLLDRVVAALAGVGGAVWARSDEGGPVELQYQINLDQTHLADTDHNRQRHRQLLQWVMEKGESTYIPPHAGLTEEGTEVNPSDFLLLLAPLVVDDQVAGVVEIFKRPGGLPSARKGYLRFLNQMCGLATDYFKNHQLRQLKQRQSVWGEFENFTRQTHLTLNSSQMCYTLANEGRRFIDADRVSVAIKAGGRCYLEAVSGQDLLNRRSNTVRLLDKLVTTVIRTDEPFWYTDTTSDIAPQIEKVLHEYVDESHTRALAILPLRRPIPAKKDEGESEPEITRGKTIGAVVVELFDKGNFDTGMQQRIESVCEHGSIGLHNSLEHSRIFLLPLWKLLGKATWFVRAQTLPKTALAIAAIIGVIYFFGFVHWDFDIEGDGKLQPKVRRDVFAPLDGDVTLVNVRHRSPVEAGNVLVELVNEDIQIEETRVLGEKSSAEARAAALEAAISDPEIDRNERSKMNVEIKEVQAKIASLQKELELIQRKKAELVVHAPMEGQVITWNVEETLTARPVQRGQVLMTIADTTKGWELEVLMEEDRMGHILDAKRALPAGEPLKTEFILATDPNTTYEGEIVNIAMAAETEGEEGNVVKLTVKFEIDDLDETVRQKLRPGAAVQVKVKCGQAPVGYVLFHDVWEWIQKNVLFKL